jgi:hypothetical protein
MFMEGRAFEDAVRQLAIVLREPGAGQDGTHPRKPVYERLEVGSRE